MVCCPACKDEDFNFQEIQSKIVKSLLENLNVKHVCSDKKDEGKVYSYKELKVHILSECSSFKYQCILCKNAPAQNESDDPDLQEEIKVAEGKGISIVPRTSNKQGNNLQKLDQKKDKLNEITQDPKSILMEELKIENLEFMCHNSLAEHL